MTDAEFTAFLDDASALLGLSADGYRRTRGSIRKRLSRRIRELGLTSLGDYRRQLASHPDEWIWLDACCRITISRFARDRSVFDALVDTHLPACARAALARGDDGVRVWSAGCASGEEPYSLSLAWSIELAPRFASLRFDVLATDADPTVLARAERAAYPAGSLRELPERWRRAFREDEHVWTLAPPLRDSVRFRRADLRRELPAGPFDLICCRNLAFTYFDASTQERLARAFAERLLPGGFVLVGRGEEIPGGSGLARRELGFYAAPAQRIG